MDEPSKFSIQVVDQTYAFLDKTERFFKSLQIYHKYFYNHYVITFMLPFIMAFMSFYSWYYLHFKKLAPRIRKKRLVEYQVAMLKKIGLVIIFPNMMIVIIYGKFDNEFLRISISVATGMHVYYSYIHYIVRILVVLANIFCITAIEYWYMRESLM